jgi:hypothetical protein
VDKRVFRLAHRVTQTVIAALFALDMIAIWYCDRVLTHDRPLKPTGAYSIEYPNHGTSTFITNSDRLLSISLWVGLLVLFGISALLHQFSRPNWRDVAGRKVFP